MKKLLIILVAALAGACNSGEKSSNSGTASSDMSTDSATTLTSVDTTVSNFISAAMMANAMEVEAAQLALEKSRNLEVKDFANMMVSDHGKATKQLKDLAGRKRVELPMMVDSDKDWAAPENSAAKTASDEEEEHGSQSRPGRDLTGNAAGSNPDASAGSNTGSASAGGNAKYVSHQDKLNKLRLRTGNDFDREYMKMMVKDHEDAVALFSKGTKNSDPDVRTFAEETLPTLKKHEKESHALLNSLQSAKN
jgi:putative membrane protein